jgi:STE24 endopeptidase
MPAMNPCGVNSVFRFSAGIALALVICATTGFAQADQTPTPSGKGGEWSAQASDRAPGEVKGYTLPPEKYRQAIELNRAFYWRYFLAFLYAVAVYLFILRRRVAMKYRMWAENVASKRIVQAAIVVPLLLFTVAFANLPRSIIGQWLLRKYGLSVASWGTWAGDWMKGQTINAVIVTFVVWIFYGLMRRSARRWWFYAWLISIPLAIFAVVLAPVVIDPMFYKFEPLDLAHPQLVSEIERVVQRGGLQIPRERMFEMKASAKTREVNAYVTGIGPTLRVVVWDTTIKNSDTPETLAVFGHEMGHYVLGHVWKGLAMELAGALLALYLGHRLAGAAESRWGRQWGILSLDDYASLPLFLLLFSLFNFFGAPIENAVSRYIEHQADVYGLEVTHGMFPDSGGVAAQSFQKLGEIDLEDPEPSAFIRMWLYSHPPINDRIIFAQTYNPWAKGEKPQFVP